MKKILVVDDDPEMGRLLRTLFELEGYEVTVTSRYPEILPSVRHTMPDIILLDVRVQDKETIELMRQLRQDDELAHIPVIMTSGMDVKTACLEAGAAQFVLKPFLPSDMTKIVVDLLG
jgi:CheY-like chemotaxis protein